VLTIHLSTLLIRVSVGEIYGGLHGKAMGGTFAEAGLDLSVQAAVEERVAAAAVGPSQRKW
jgi:hypothetical protein